MRIVCSKSWAAVIALGLLASVAQSAAAQTAAELGPTLEPGDRIFATDRNGVQTAGRVLRLSPQELTLLVDGSERVISRSRIGRIEKRDALWNGMLIGAVPAALIGAAAAGASCSPHCGRDTAIGAIVLGGVGAGIGALVDARVHGYAIVDGPSLASPNAFRVASPVTSLDDLWRRVRQGDAIEVVTHSGQKVAGEFVQVSGTSVTLMADGDRREIPSAEVRQVTRSGRRYRSGALWGGTILAGIGLFASASCSGEGCGSPLFVAAFTGTAGVLWGAAIGAAIPRHAVVYRSGASSTVRVMPMMGPDRFGVAFSATF